MHSTNISNIGGQPGSFGAKIGSAMAPSAVLDFSARVTNTVGIQIEGASAVLTACEIANSDWWDLCAERCGIGEHQRVQHHRQWYRHHEPGKRVGGRDRQLVGATPLARRAIAEPWTLPVGWAGRYRLGY